MVNVEFALKLHPRYANGPRAEEGMNGYVDHRLDCPRPKSSSSRDRASFLIYSLGSSVRSSVAGCLARSAMLG